MASPAPSLRLQNRDWLLRKEFERREAFAFIHCFPKKSTKTGGTGPSRRSLEELKKEMGIK